MCNRTRAILMFAAATAVALAASCAAKRPVPPAATASQRVTQGISEQQATIANQVVSKEEEDRMLDAAWYAKVGRPRILALFNRQFSGSEATWSGDWRVVVTKQGAEIKQAGDAPPEKKTTDDTEVIRGETRATPPAGPLSQENATRLCAAFQQPFLAAGCAVVDPGVVERIALAAAPKASSPEAEDTAINAFLKEADWVIEVIAVPSKEEAQRFFLSAKIVDLRSRRILGVASTHDMPSRTRLPGSPRADQKPITIEDQAQWLAKEVALQAPSAETGK